MTFEDLSPHPSLLQALALKGYAQPTPVQALILGAEHAGKDLLVSAQTGSGKTVAFGLAIAPELLGQATRLEAAKPKAPMALVIAPTRELALQVQQELAWLYAGTGARVRACVGGMDPRKEQRALAEGAHIVVGTPGRLCDHLDRRNLDLSHLRAVVLDEADEMLDMGFREELERILRDAPVERRTLLLSATLPSAIAQLAGRYQRNAVRLAATPPEQAHQDIEYRACAIAPRETEHAVVNTLRQLEPAAALVFCATRDGVNHLQSNLSERGFQAVAISGELTQPERLRALQALRDGRARVLVATDVAARGLDLPALDLVLHSDLPRDAQVLQHRSGRTGRAGRKGISVLLVPFRLRAVAERMLKSARVKARWTPVATLEEIRALDHDRLVKAAGELCGESLEDDLGVARTLLEKHGPEPLASALVRLLRARLPAPEELVETASFLLRGKVPRATEHRPPANAPRFPVRGTSASHAQAHAHSRSPAHGPPTPGAGPVEGSWFQLNVGRLTNADPRWLVPLICRRGGVTKADIGKIVIFPKETRFLVSAGAAAAFGQAIRRPDKKDPAIRIEPYRTESRSSQDERLSPRPLRPPRSQRPDRPRRA
ncbi:MAG: DEAD/DEAH box helicase [Deltaproteobacteria bacterium]|nr:DEAD/DEAH box helicase [Deltaproteobacteria bacterium]